MEFFYFIKQKANWSFQILCCQLFTNFDKLIDVSEPCHIPRITVYGLRKKRITELLTKLISNAIHKKFWNDIVHGTDLLDPDHTDTVSTEKIWYIYSKILHTQITDCLAWTHIKKKCKK